MTPDMLQQYSVIVQFLGKTLGPDYEIVLHDLNPDHNEIVAIANSHVSGRNIGSPLTNASLKMLIDKAYETDDFLCNYKGVAEDRHGHMLRSSTMFIKDAQALPAAAGCPFVHYSSVRIYPGAPFFSKRHFWCFASPDSLLCKSRAGTGANHRKLFHGYPVTHAQDVCRRYGHNFYPY